MIADPAAPSALDGRLAELRARVRTLSGGVVVALSGGVDSALLLKVCFDELGDAVLAVTADSPSLPNHDRDDARALVAALGVRHRFVATNEMDDERYRRNAADRCYFCKHTLFEALEPIARESGLRFLAYGANKDDEGDFRPGHRAAREFEVRAPLLECGLRKGEVRAIAKGLGLAAWDKPASACLASRIPYGTPIDPRVLARIDAAEASLRALGFRQLRVRHHGDVARLEVDPAEVGRALELRATIARQLRELGWVHAALDLEGYRQGSLNEAL